MSEKEIIKTLEEIIQKNQQVVKEAYKNKDINTMQLVADIDNEAIAIQGLLDLYNKEKEKNKNLELCLKAEEKYSEGLNRDIKSLLNIEPNTNFISKDKIKQCIGKLLEHKENINEKFDKAFYNLTDIIEFEIKVLQELLEERN